MLESFQLVDIFIILGISQGILLSLALWRIIDKNRKANIILCRLLIIATLMLAGRFLFFRYLNNWIFQWSLWVDIVIFLFGPLLYTYVRRFLFSENSGYQLSILHYIPAFAMFLFSFGSIMLFSPDEYFELYLNGNLDYIYAVIILLGITSNAYYLYHSFKLFKKYKRKEKSNLSFNQDPISYLHFFLLSIAIFLLVWVVSFFIFFLFEISVTYINYDSVWASISLFIYVVGYFSLKQPELFRLQIEPILNEKEQKERLSKDDIAILKENMDSLMQSDKLYLQPDLTMKDLAENLQTSTNNISWLLNSVYNLNFYDYINKYRINEFLARLENKEHIQRTILGLSKDVGFKSKSTFYKAFKSSMNETPSSYIKRFYG